ncbi:RNA polymerase sigma factor [Niallia taxi]|uniref:RNA polymerase sigma factor n=1 Tax=Niallia taxi TaxID=2499688 RepID=UPI00300B414D
MLYANNAQVTSWYLKYRVDVYKYINSLVLEPTLAEDLMQETFVKAFLYSSTFEGRSSVKTWLYSIAYNLTMDFYKKKQSFQKFKNNYIKNQNWNKVLFDITNWEEYTELIDTLNNLKDSYKQVIILRKLQGYSVKETGEILNWSENKVKVTLSRAIRSLRNQLI